MGDLVRRCEVCESLLDEEDLFCANCGTEAPAGEGESRPAATVGRLARTNFTCSGCGASMSYDASAAALRCPFCGSVDMVAKPDAKTLAPSCVIPFQLEREKALAVMHGWLGRGFWRPGDLAQRASIVTMVPVYVPYWVFHAHTWTYWTADTSQTPAGARADWYPLAGERQGHYLGLLVGASGALTAGETAAICPFEISAGVGPEEIDLENVTVEEFAVPRKYARPLAHQGLDGSESAAVAAECVPGQSRNVHVNVRVESLESEPVLLPVWIMAYRYGDQVHRFLINGQSGRATGTAPTSWAKVSMAVVILLVAAVLGLLVCSGVLGRSLSQATPRSHVPASRVWSTGGPHPLRPSGGVPESDILTAIVDSRFLMPTQPIIAIHPAYRPKGLECGAPVAVGRASAMRASVVLRTVGIDEPGTDFAAAEGDARRGPRPASAAHARHGGSAGGV